MPHTNALRSHRKRWALTQRELARLLGLRARSVISSHELSHTLPALRVALAYQFIFGVPLEALFPHTCKQVEDDVLRRAADLDELYRGRTDRTAVLKRKLLGELVTRADSPSV